MRLPPSVAFREKVIGATREWEGQVDYRHDNLA